MDGFGALVGEAIGPLLDEVEIRQGDRVLDVGTGPGLVAAAVAEREADVVGIDFSEAMLAKARHLHADVEFKLAPAESLPFDEGSFEAVIGNFVLHHSGQPDEVLRETFRVLRPGGRAGFTVWADLLSSKRSVCSLQQSRSTPGLQSFLMVLCSESATSMSSIRWYAAQDSVTRLSQKCR